MKGKAATYNPIQGFQANGDSIDFLNYLLDLTESNRLIFIKCYTLKCDYQDFSLNKSEKRIAKNKYYAFLEKMIGKFRISYEDVCFCLDTMIISYTEILYVRNLDNQIINELFWH